MGMARQSQATVGRASVPVLLTRPRAQSLRLAEVLRIRFGARVTPILSPLLEPEFQSPPLPQRPFAAVIFTSETAVHAAFGLRQARAVLPETAICVGDRTAEVARECGFLARSAAGDADALVALILSDHSQPPLLYLHGKETRGNVAERLNSAGLETVSVQLYHQIPQPLSDEALAVLAKSGPVIAPLFSPRTAQFLAAALPTAMQARLGIVALSKAVAEAARGISAESVSIAQRPDTDAMLEAIADVLGGHGS
jgi:uroporphyrinogen-III synthase